MSFHHNQLRGLQHPTSPTRARSIICYQGLNGQHGDEITSTIRMCAAALYNHEKLSKPFEARIQHGGNCVAFFLYAAHGQNFTPNARPILDTRNWRTNASLELAYWKGAYLATVTEIHLLYSEINRAFASGMEGTYKLHFCGRDGTSSNDPFTIFDLAACLEEMWSLLMDESLIGPIEIKVREYSFREQYGGQHGQQDLDRMGEEEKVARLEGVKGMMDLASNSPHTVMAYLWTQEMEEICLRCRNDFDIEITPLVGTEDVVGTEMDCECPEDCGCRRVCQFGVRECDCKAARQQHPRVDTAQGELANVPYRGAVWDHRQVKDATPLAFYGRGGSPGRYPRVPVRESMPTGGPPAPPRSLPALRDSRPKAVKQRWLPAGGTARLEDREELEGFAIPPPTDPGLNMPRKEVMAALNVTASSPERRQTRDADTRARKGSSASARLKSWFKRDHFHFHSSSQ